MNKQHIKHSLSFARKSLASHLPDRQYDVESQKFTLESQHSTSLAVIIHLYYPEMWHIFREKILMITEPYDLFITTTPEKYDEVIKNVDLPDHATTIVTFPNRGRDILPFLTLAKILSTKGYTKFLKLHSKKSPHRQDGDKWSSTIIDNLLPDSKTISRALELLDDTKTGIIGPEGEYLQLTVNFEANGVYMTDILSHIYSKDVSFHMLQTKRLDYGFFAGSMFWANYDSLGPLLSSRFIKRVYYEEETGQIDGTFAHAVERIFTLISEIEHRDIYEISRRQLRKISYRTDNIPDWSKVSIKS